jgi:hypothetical protein
MFFKSTKHGHGKGSHYHVYYVQDELLVEYLQSGSGVIVPLGSDLVSTDNKHSHGMELTPKGIRLVSANGHTHETEEQIENGEINLPNKKNKTQLIRDILELKRVAETLESDFRDKAGESEKYYEGTGHWDEGVVAEKDEKELAAITINEIQNKMNILSGYLRQNRTDIKFYPTEDGDERVADVLTHVVKNITEQTDYAYEEVDAFEDQVIVGRGFLYPHIDRERNVNGQIMISQLPWDKCWLGPHSKKNLSDLEYLLIPERFSFRKVEQMYPEKSKEIQQDIIALQELSAMPSKMQEDIDDPYFGKGAQQIKDQLKSFVDLAKKEYTVITTYQKIYTRVYVLVYNGDVLNGGDAAIGWDDKDIAKIRTIQDVEVISTVRHDIRMTKSAGFVVLEDELDTDYEGDFPVIPLYATKRKDVVFGKVEAAKGAQNMLNKGVSHFIDQVNRTGASGYIYTDESFDDPRDESAFRENASTPGFFLRVSSFDKAPQAKEPPSVAREVPALIQLGSDKVRESMGIIPELEGFQGRAESGIAIMEKKRQGLVGNEFLFDNLSLAKKMLGRILVKLIRNNYTTDILVNRSRKMKLQVAGQQLDPNDEAMMEGIRQALEESDLLQYDVTVGESEFSPTLRHATFVILSELARNGFPIPPEAVIEISPLPDKEKYLEMIRQQREAEAQAEERKNQVELQKSGKSGGGQNLPAEATQGL